MSCDNGEGCYSPEERCDRYVQCNDNSDEIGCTCSDYIRNVAEEKVCDGYNDCPDGSDEKGKINFLSEDDLLNPKPLENFAHSGSRC